LDFSGKLPGAITHRPEVPFNLWQIIIVPLPRDIRYDPGEEGIRQTTQGRGKPCEINRLRLQFPVENVVGQVLLIVQFPRFRRRKDSQEEGERGFVIENQQTVSPGK